MKYIVRRTSDLTWEVEKDDEDSDEIHYVNYDIFKDRFICDCNFNASTEVDCNHISFVKQNIAYGKEIVDYLNNTEVCKE